MEENFAPPPALARIFSRLVPIFALLLCLSSRAQTTNLNLCTEGALQAVVGAGGIYQFGNCGTNVIPIISITEPLVVAHDLTLMSTQQVLLEAQGATRLMVVKPGVHLTLRNIFFFSGQQTDTNMNNGGIPDTAGGAIYNDGGIITILDGHFEANSVAGVTGFPGSSTGDNGETGGDAAGGAIYNNGGQILLSNVVFVGNSVIAGAGGAGATSGSFGGSAGNGGSGGSGSGGAIYSRGGSVTIYGSTFTTNNATGAVGGAAGVGQGLLGFPGEPGQAGDGAGGAISGDGGGLTVYGCTFFGNSVIGANALAGNAGRFERTGERGLDGGNASGGAIFSTGTLLLTNSTFFSNTTRSGNGGAGGAGGTSGFGGSGGNGGSGGSATGGAVESTTGQSVVVNCTFSDNATIGGTAGAAGAASGLGDPGRTGNAGVTNGGSIYGRSGQVILANNILVNSKVTVGGTVTDAGGNITTDLNPLINSTMSMRLTNPLLSGLANNGGPTETMAIATNSPAIGHAIAQYCPQFDQRWSNRVASCDAGAYEVIIGGQALPPVPTSVLNGLTISQSTNLVTLSWPTGYTNLFLQYATNLLSSNTAWAIAPLVQSTNSGSNVVSVNATNSSRPKLFFRLFGPTNATQISTNTSSGGPPVPTL